MNSSWEGWEINYKFEFFYPKHFLSILIENNYFCGIISAGVKKVGIEQAPYPLSIELYDPLFISEWLYAIQMALPHIDLYAHILCPQTFMRSTHINILCIWFIHLCITYITDTYLDTMTKPALSKTYQWYWNSLFKVS